MSPSVPGFDSDIFLLFGSTFTYAKRTVREYSRLALCPRIWGYVPRNADGTEQYAKSPQWLRSDALFALGTALFYLFCTQREPAAGWHYCTMINSDPSS